ncbi:hypothetical protein M9H77_25105 [Catharanthus roseus]|uniref:Uncharacterized protein n=1 Tax=Catharanthus roseus TaxID=4058 RepID=A0ACC0A8M6_CATRO|nr:hypothetical protein M9H77_25105 [Catharanthus roseus]
MIVLFLWIAIIGKDISSQFLRCSGTFDSLFTIRGYSLWSLIEVEFLGTPVQTTTYNIVEPHSKKRHPVYDPFVFSHQVEQVSYVTYPGAKRQKIDWWAILKSRPRVFNVSVVEVAFQEDVGIAKTSLVDPMIEGISPLAHESGVSDIVDLIGGCEDDSPTTKIIKKKQHMNQMMIPTLTFVLAGITSPGRKTPRLDSAGTSTSVGSKSDVRVGDVEVSIVASDTSTTSVDAPAGVEQSVDPGLE